MKDSKLSKIKESPFALRKWFYQRNIFIIVVYVFILFNTFCTLIQKASDVAVFVSLLLVVAIVDVIWFRIKAVI